VSFLSVLGSIFGKIEAVVGKVNPVITALEPAIAAVPVYGPAFDAVFNAVVGAEQLFLPVPASGAAKKAAVTAIAASVVPVAAPESVSKAIDGIVAALNTLQAAQAALSPPVLAA